MDYKFNYEQHEISSYDFEMGMYGVNFYLECQIKDCKFDLAYWIKALEEETNANNHHMICYCQAKVEQCEYGLKLLEGMEATIQGSLLNRVCERKEV